MLNDSSGRQECIPAFNFSWHSFTMDSPVGHFSYVVSLFESGLIQEVMSSGHQQQVEQLVFCNPVQLLTVPFSPKGIFASSFNNSPAQYQ